MSPAFVTEAFLWTPSGAMRSLRELLANDLGLDLTGWSLDSANAITPDGLTIVGAGTNPSGQAEAWIAHLPEPAPLAPLAAATGLSLAIPGRRKRPLSARP